VRRLQDAASGYGPQSQRGRCLLISRGAAVTVLPPSIHGAGHRGMKVLISMVYIVSAGVLTSFS